MSPIVGSFTSGGSFGRRGGVQKILTGGTITTSGAYTIHRFTGDESFNYVSGPSNLTVEYLIAAGGGGGGAWVGGGGGAGGLRIGSTTISPGSYVVDVGSGGAREVNPGSYGGMPAATNGQNSSVFGIVATGGGYGGSWSPYGATTGGSGGGNGFSYAGAAGTAGQGNAGGQGRGDSPNGYPTGGGGGAGGVGGNWTTSKSGDGGIGVQSSITGTATYYCGGGGGGVHGSSSNANPGLGGLGGGGRGDRPNDGTGSGASERLSGTTDPTGEDGFPNTGGGGGGSGRNGGQRSIGGNGGSGVVIIRYLT